ncbi:methylisocitrate lyase [Legionella sp. 16cNR16C]|uniref:methylisocitrate lyase n=1 Tax=Legionella sp. 16cNR16C TaxID=2905656 RepID=UPI001E4682F5|nr:methylisocitrate lyase [Legionella sp. 16cNR16C]MCE3043860.1 methylisocitrate lyase [Legionella sp. 16cNR16C]
MTESAGKRFRLLVKTQAPLQVMGTINAYCAMLAERAGCQAIYLSGAGVANASHGLPDLGMTSLQEVAEDARRITSVSELPLLVDVDTGWGHAFNIARTIRTMEDAKVAAIHIEDQVIAKRCGHRPNKAIVSMSEMGDRIKAAVDARTDEQFVIMARTDAYSVEGMTAAIERAQLCVELGADMIFPEAMASLDEYKQFTDSLPVPVLANITEFGKTPLFTRDELKKAGISLILYPLSAFRAMSKAALQMYETILNQGTQSSLLDSMQTREELYDVLGYHRYEQILDQLREKEDGQ